MGSSVYRWVSYAVVLAVTVILAVWQFQFVDKYALNILYWDQWDLYSPIFNHWGIWQLFTFQHGPHRQGVGFLITPLLARWSGCNTRWDAFAISYTLMTACLCGLILCVRCGVKQPIALLAVPLMYLTIRQYDSFSGPSNLSHGAMPILLFTLLCLAWFIDNDAVRISTISLLTFALIFTGFGLFVGLLTPIVLTVEVVQSLRQKQPAQATIAALGILACAISWGLFSIGYRFDSSNPDFHFPYPKPWEYFEFVAIMLTNFFGAAGDNPLALPLGLLLTLALTAICVHHARRVIRLGTLTQRPSVVIFLLSAYALIFCFNTAIGRVSLGWKTAGQESRYVTLMIPAGMAILLHLATLSRTRRATTLAVIYAAVILPGAVQLSAHEWYIVHFIHNRRIAWRDAYVVTHEEISANAISKSWVYPRPGVIEDRLKFVEVNRLNFFQDVPSQPAR